MNTSTYQPASVELLAFCLYWFGQRGDTPAWCLVWCTCPFLESALHAEIPIVCIPFTTATLKFKSLLYF